MDTALAVIIGIAYLAGAAYTIWSLDREYENNSDVLDSFVIGILAAFWPLTLAIRAWVKY